MPELQGPHVWGLEVGCPASHFSRNLAKDQLAVPSYAEVAEPSAKEFDRRLESQDEPFVLRDVVGHFLTQPHPTTIQSPGCALGKYVPPPHLHPVFFGLPRQTAGLRRGDPRALPVCCLGAGWGMGFLRRYHKQG